MNIVFLVAGAATGRRLPLLDGARMATLALHRGMLTQQRKICPSVIKRHRPPVARYVAVGTRHAVAALVNVIFRVASVAGPRQRIADILYVTGFAFRGDVLPDEREARPGMVETLHLPSGLDVAGRTVPTEFSSMRIVLRVT